MDPLSWSARVSTQLGALSLSVAVDGGPEPVLVIGENGAGKSTLLRILAGALPATGRVVVGGAVLLDTAAGICLPPQARRIGYVPQGFGLFPHLTVAGNVGFGLSGPDRAARTAALLEAMELSALSGHRPRALSGGQKQRVALARALAVRPRLLLLDEPLAALDVGARRRMRAVLAEHLAAVPSVVVTHDVRDVHTLGGAVVVLEAGRVVQAGPAAAVAAAPATAFVEEFFST